MKFKWIFAGFVLLVAACFAALLPFAHSVAREIRRSRDQFPSDLAAFEESLRSQDVATLHAGLSFALRQSISEQVLLSQKEKLAPPQATHLQSLGDYSAFGWRAGWVDATGEPVGDVRFEFWWEDGRHKLRRVPGILEPSRRPVIR